MTDASAPATGQVGGITALMVSKNAEIARLLIDAGLDIEARDTVGRTALMYACAFGHSDVVALLIAKGADTDARDVNGHTALFYACSPLFTVSDVPTVRLE